MKDSAKSAAQGRPAPALGEEKRSRPPASEAVRSEWGRRIQAEYRSAAITQHLTLWLIQIGASPDVIHAGLRIVRDELTHARMSHRVYTQAGGVVMTSVTRETLGLHKPDAEPLEHAVVRACVEIFCLGETVAVPLFKVLREECTVPSARAALDRILRDEVRHRDFGWTTLGHLLELPSAPELSALIARELPGMLARVRRSYMPPGGQKQTRISPDDRAWGLMPIARYGEILERTVERHYVPRFREHAIDAADAWQKAVTATTRPNPT